jgi:hypothetical protein
MKNFDENFLIDEYSLISNFEEFHCLIMIIVVFLLINFQVQIQLEDKSITNL